MLLINLVYLFLGSSFFSLLSNSSTALYFVRSGWYSSGLKIFFVPNYASPNVWEKTFPGKVCKPLTPKGLLQEILAPGICILADEPKGLMVVSPPVSLFPSFVCKPLTPKGLFQEAFAPSVCLLADEPKGLMVPPPAASLFCPFDPLPPLFTLISRAKAFASTAKVLYQKLQVEGLNPNYLRFVLNIAFGHFNSEYKWK
ncbi:hypothetical protein EDC94DRAFT_580966 [Helicostylum pulchrum]|nr:hypothetical protein EDC94DRAFT_580966 [Helicostylum pulchrum]